MSMKIERVFRDHWLSAEEIVKDDEVRHKVQAEFPPAPQSERVPGVLSQALRDAIRASDKSVDQIAQDAGVSQIVVLRFVSGERDIHMGPCPKRGYYFAV